MKAEEIIKALEERIQKERDYQLSIPNNDYEDVISNIDYYVNGLEFAIKIVKDLNKQIMKEILKCEECNDKGWIDTYNTNTNTQEIQRCDECKVFASDKDAQEFINQ